jgi:hypothetical protein
MMNKKMIIMMMDEQMKEDMDITAYFKALP